VKYSTLQLREKAVSAYLNSFDVEEISSIYDVHRATVYRWVAKQNSESSLERKRSPGSGRPKKMTENQIKQIIKMILKPASRYGYETDFWTIRRIIQVAKKILNLVISKTTMYEMLYNVNYSYKKPEKRYYEANKMEQEEWIKKEVPKIKKCVRKYRAILYFEDESNISLDAVLGKTWGPIGKKTIHKSTGNRASVTAMSAITDAGGLIFTLHEKRITAVEVIHFLDQMLKHHPRRHIVVVMDKAPPHTAIITKSYIANQKRLHVFYLPSRSPEFNADEKIWNYLKNEEMKSHKATNKDQLKELARKKLTSMSKKPELLRALFKRSEVAEFFC
jgi:transposase